MTHRFSVPLLVIGVMLLAGISAGVSAPSQIMAEAPPTKAVDDTFEKKIQPFLKAHCSSCHNSDKSAGGLDLGVYQSELHARKDRKTWDEIHRVLAAGEMPPKKSKSQPSKDDKAFVQTWIETALTKVDCTGPKDPGRVTLRRLNRAEYNTTIRDLCGISNFKPADDFPSDDVGYGFDNIGDVLSMQPILIEKYMAAADKILETALSPVEGLKSSNQAFKPQNMLSEPRSIKVRDANRKGRDKLVFTEEGIAYLDKFHFPADGEYLIRSKAWGVPINEELPKLTFRVDGKDIKTFSVDASDGKAKTYETKVRVAEGERRVAVAFVNPTKAKIDDKLRTLNVDTLEVEGPLGGVKSTMPESAKLILIATPKAATEKAMAAEKVLTTFARRAFRRPATAGEIKRLMALYSLADSKGEAFEQAIRLPLKAVLVSPHFLFRIEDDPKNPDDTRILNDHELATRLSYFLWSSMPDEELSRIADKGELRKTGMLEAQVKRMLKDPKSSALVENFAGQWLMLRSIRGLTPDSETFPNWDEKLRKAAVRETELFFDYIVREDRSVLDFLDADYTFVNERLARHYGIKGVTGSEFQKVKLSDGRRGGVVTQASVLLVTSNPTRTSPVKRGKWVYENILGLSAPPPPPDVPELPPTPQLKGTVRQQMEQHRVNPGCASCHAKLDPLGFGLENFDAIGAWRDSDNKKPIDASGVLPDGAKFDGPAEMRKVLLAKSDLFRHCLAEKLTTFALGRGLEYYDKCMLDEMTAKAKKGGDKFSSLVLAIVESDPFQKRRGKRSE